MSHSERMSRSKPQPKQSGTSAQSAYHRSSTGSAPQTAGGGHSTSSRAFGSLIERSITAWNSLTYVGEPEQRDGNLKRHADILRALHSLDDLFESKTMFWFFQRRESFIKQNKFLKWDPSRLDEYILLPVSQGFVNTNDCFYVSHFWNTKKHPDPKGEDFRLIRGDLAGLSWKYIWIDWTCLPQSRRSGIQEKYFTTMLLRSPILMRGCGFEWRYPNFQPRLWILFEVAQYVVANTNRNLVTLDIQPFVKDVLSMEKEGVQHVIRERGYTCTMPQDYRLLVGWLELTIIMSRLAANESHRRPLRNAIDFPTIEVILNAEPNTVVDKVNGIVSQYGSVYRFVPLWPVNEDGLPEVVAEPSRLQPPACVDQLIAHMKHPELSQAKKELTENQHTLGMDHADTIASVGKLADVFMKLEQYREAEELHRQALTSLQNTLGPEHLHTADSIHKLAKAVIKLERLKEAEELRRRALTILQKMFGPDHPRTLEAVYEHYQILDAAVVAITGFGRVFTESITHQDKSVPAEDIQKALPEIHEGALRCHMIEILGLEPICYGQIAPSFGVSRGVFLGIPVAFSCRPFQFLLEEESHPVPTYERLCGCLAAMTPHHDSPGYRPRINGVVLNRHRYVVRKGFSSLTFAADALPTAYGHGYSARQHPPNS
ncbi:hypothetical protein DL770_002677 [Monosporascus sp. CRB-9-2]|nr:hypothetical protein DL770_002677 [Monosporascus sp. CRB-9-2]